jgi:hypothetical protein
MTSRALPQKPFLYSPFLYSSFRTNQPNNMTTLKLEIPALYLVAGAFLLGLILGAVIL